MYHILYTEDSSPGLKSFSTKEEAMKFVANFLLKYQSEFNNGYWIDYVIEGEVLYCEQNRNFKVG